MLVALWGSITAAAHAQSPGLRLVLVQPENSELITRVEGQTRDLGVALQVAPSGWTRGTAEQAAAIAADRDADFVARLQRGAGGVLEVRVYAARTRTLRARRVPHARSERLGTSAELEAAALVLRGELTALIEAEREAAAARETSPPGGGGSGTPPGAAGGTASETGAGDSSPQRQPEQPKPAEQPKPRPTEPKPREPDTDRATDEDEPEEPEEDDDVDEPSPPLENYTAHRSPWTLRGGIRGSIPIDEHIAGSLLVGARAPVVPYLELGLSLATALPFAITDQTARITLWRNALNVEALAAIPVGPRLRALIGVDAGVVLYARKTDRAPAGYTAEGSEPSWGATLGAQAELQWLLTRQFGVALGFGLSYLPQRTRFAYPDNSPSQLHEIAELRALEPHATASLFGLLGD